MLHVGGKFRKRAQALSPGKQGVLILVLVSRREQGYLWCVLWQFMDSELFLHCQILRSNKYVWGTAAQNKKSTHAFVVFNPVL